jgi:DNA-binding MarR family transcriptional regulator
MDVNSTLNDLNRDKIKIFLDTRSKRYLQCQYPPEGISEGINLLLEHIRSAPGRRIPQMADRLGIPAKTIERWIADLKRQGRIEYRGSKKAGGYYMVNAKGQGKGGRISRR